MRYFLFYTIFFLSVFGCSVSREAKNSYPTGNKPADVELYNTILNLDSAFFYAYNTCSDNLETYASFYADNIEFYHDQGGLSISKKEIVDGTKKFICGKVTRELVKGSVEVYPIKDFGAIEIGFHKFHNSEDPSANAEPGRFVIIWQFKNEQWKITRVVSLH